MGNRRTSGMSLDTESAGILYEGANMSQLSMLFKMDDRVLKAKMHGLQPVGKRGNAAIYDVAQVAARCGKLTAEQVDEAMKRLNHADLPKELTKEYWAGLRSRQAYLREEGELWPTEHVVEAISDLFKLVKMSTQLMVDTVERQMELSDRQREVVKNLGDGMIKDLRGKIVQTFNDPKYRTRAKHMPPLENVPAPEDDGDDL